MGIGWSNGKWLARCVFIVWLCCSLPFTSRAQSNAWDVAVLDKILANVAPRQNVAQVGDMFIQVSYLQAWRNQLAGGPQPLIAFQGPTIPIWTGGNLYYAFSNNVSAAHQTAFIDGMNEWAMFANLHFIQRTTQSNYFTIVDGGTFQEGGNSAVGMVGGQQFINIGSTSWNRPTICHELGHTLGLVHEQQRSDRNSYVTILTNNIIPGQEGNFVLLTNSVNETDYDFLSIMEYSRNELSISNTLDTIEPLPAYNQYINLMGQADPVLSALDRAGMALVYGPPATPVTNIVINTQDSGYGSLRAAMYYAFDHPGTTIKFNIPTSDPGFSNGVFTIMPTAGLLSLVNGMVIDGSTEPTNYNPNGPAIVLNGSLMAFSDSYVNGIHMTGTNCAVRSLVINGFNLNGVAIEGTNAVGNVVAGCYIGTDPSGTTSVSNSIYNVLIDTAAQSNTVGGITDSARNILSGSAFNSLVISGADVIGNTVLGNYIGLNAAGTVALPDGGAGVYVEFGAASNTIGGVSAGAGNVISGNGTQGIYIQGSAGDGNVIQGNYIGLNAAGTTAIANGFAGIEIDSGPQLTQVGGTLSAARNVISGNTLQGIGIFGANSSVVQGNFIGLNAAGTAAVSNLAAGIEIDDGAQSNIVGGVAPGAGNVLSGNFTQGIGIFGSNTAANVVQGNFIGTDPLGISAIGNRFAGIEINEGASSNVIGGTTTAARNIISGNAAQGLYLDDVNTDGNQILGNYIGVNVTGGTALGNGFSGIELCCGASSNMLGGTTSGAGNLISGNANYGIYLGGAGTDGTFIEGNLIGVDATGAFAVPNAFDGVYVYGGAQLTRIGGTAPGARNVISGNFGRGVGIFDPGTKNNSVQGNFIGLNAAGSVAVGNGYTGVNIGNGCQSNTIGGAIGVRNIISGNSNSGIIVEDTNTAGNVIQGNTVGLDVTGTLAIPNQYDGVAVFNTASFNQIGGTTLGSANLIASNGSYGVEVDDIGTTNNSILGNSIYGNAFEGIALFSGDYSLPAPSLTTAVLGTNTTVSGSLASSSNATFRIEFFASPAGTVNVQGETFVGAINATTGNGGTVNFSAGLGNTVPAGAFITATATDPSGNTSPFSSPVTVTTTDSVGDGIPDLWRKTYFGGTGTTTNGQSCASCDPDGDGFSNLQEFYAGTDPTKAASAFRITSVQNGVTGVIISFPGVAGKTYRVDRRNDMILSPWTLMVDQIVGTGGTIHIIDPSAIGLSERFYRADVLP
ncbi:MAG: M12 family metallopeptidase [Verrucomicrobiia bacterium]